VNKFRAWDKRESEYDTVSDFAITTAGELLISRGVGDFDTAKQERYTIEHQAGETYDGKPVFDGDIIKPENGRAETVFYGEREKQWRAGCSMGLGFMLEPAHRAKIIGTIHDKGEG
jgi:hypothetical protein